MNCFFFLFDENLLKMLNSIDSGIFSNLFRKWANGFEPMWTQITYCTAVKMCVCVCALVHFHMKNGQHSAKLLNFILFIQRHFKAFSTISRHYNIFYINHYGCRLTDISHIIHHHDNWSCIKLLKLAITVAIHEKRNPNKYTIYIYIIHCILFI